MKHLALRFWPALAGLTGLAFAVRMAVAGRSLDALDAWFIPDDTYYVLAIARSIAEGLGPTANGEVLTSGFQPLLAFLLVPVFALTTDLELPIRAALVLLGACDVANVLLLGWLGRKWQGPVAGLLAAGMWAISPIALDNALGGLETALALTTILAVVALWVRHREQPSVRSALALGALVGLALLARVDAVFLVLIVGWVELSGRERRYLLAIVPTSLAVVAPWWTYCLAKFGSVVPDSGAAAREVAYAYQGDYLNPLSETLWATWTVLGPPFVELRALRVSLYALAGPMPVLSLFSCLAGAVVVALLVVPTTVRVSHSLDAARRSPFLAFVAYGALLAAFYAYYLPVLWFFRRYTSPTAAVITVLLAMILVPLWEARSRYAARLVLAVLGAGMVVSILGVGERLFSKVAIEELNAVDGPTGHRAPTIELLAKVPRGAVVAGLQSGALSYFAPEGVRVHNLDGVVDREAASAFRERELGALLREREVTYFLDWRLQEEMLIDRSGVVPLILEPVAVASTAQQSGHRLRLSRLRW